MFKILIKIKSNEFNDQLKSLNIDSKANILFLKFLFAVFISLLLFIYFLNPVQILTLLHLFDIKIFNVFINPINLVLLLTLAGGNKSIIQTLQHDSYSFYSRKSSFLFFYLKEKYYILIAVITFEALVFHSVVINIISVASFLISIALMLLIVSANIYYIIFVTNKNDAVFPLGKEYVTSLLLGTLLVSISENWFGLKIIPTYVVANMTLLFLMTNLFIYSELILLKPEYKNLFSMYKYLRVPFYITWNKSVLFKKTYRSFISSNVLVAFFLFKEGIDIVNFLYYLINLFLAYIVLLYLNHRTVIYEAYKVQKNYFLYFVIIEVFFVFVTVNVILVR